MTEARLRVLLVEDNPADADLIDEALVDARGGSRFQLVGVGRLQAGLDRLAENDISAVLLDLSLPDSHGLETFTRVHAARPEVPVVVLSGLDDEDMAAQAVRAGAQDYLVKGQADGNLLVRSLHYAIERKRAEEEREQRIREQAARASMEALAAERSAVLSQTAEGVIVADPSGRVTFINDAAGRLHGVVDVGVPLEEYSSAFHLFTLDGEPYPPAELPLARAVLHGETVVDALWRIRRPDAPEIVAQGSASPVWSEDGDRLGSVLVLRDITERYTLERLKDEFLATASHDLKNPLTSIKTVAQLLHRQALRAGGLDPDRLVSGLNSIDSAVTHMTAQIDELLDITRLRMGRPLELQRTPTDLVELARQVAEAHQATTERHVLRFESGQAEVIGNWDARRLERVLENLLGNAIKYSAAGTEIAVRLALDDGEAVVTVRDQGLGIPADDLPRMFGRYQRGSNVPAKVPGTGLGLASARQIVEQHGGVITVDSREGVGSTFTVRLPLANPD